MNKLQQVGNALDGNREHISLRCILDYVYIHQLLVKTQKAHSDQTLSSGGH